MQNFKVSLVESDGSLTGLRTVHSTVVPENEVTDTRNAFNQLAETQPLHSSAWVAVVSA